jgi:hypothetical protein
MTVMFTLATLSALLLAGRYLVGLNRRAAQSAGATRLTARLYRQMMADPLDARWTGRRLACGSRQ